MKQVVPRKLKPPGKSDLDRIIEYYDKGKPLPGDLEDRRLKLEQAWDLLRLNGPKTTKLLMAKLTISKPTAIKMVRECQELFGAITKVSKDAQRAMLTAKLDRIALKAEKQKEYETAIKAIAQIVRLQRLDQPDDEDVEPIKLPTLVFITTNPSALVPEKTIDVPYETGD